MNLKNMFNKHKVERVIVDCFEGKVKCSECKCWLDKKDAHLVTNESYLIGYGKWEDYYCQAHKPKFSKTAYLNRVNHYYREVETDFKGEPLGYKKIER